MAAEGQALHFDLGARLDKPAATVLANRLRQVLTDGKLSAGQPIILDARAVERMTTNAIQVLLAVEHAAAESSRPLIICAPSDAFLSAMTDLGVPIDEMAWSVRT